MGYVCISRVLVREDTRGSHNSKMTTWTIYKCGGEIDLDIKIEFGGIRWN
jgi:hypothetical protein